MLSTVLFLGREGFRLALIKSTTIAAAAASRGSANYTENIHISNVAWLSIPTGIVLSLFCLVVHLYHCQLWKDNLNGSYTQIQQNLEEWQDYRIAGMSSELDKYSMLYCSHPSFTIKNGLV